MTSRLRRRVFRWLSLLGTLIALSNLTAAAERHAAPFWSLFLLGSLAGCSWLAVLWWTEEKRDD